MVNCPVCLEPSDPDLHCKSCDCEFCCPECYDDHYVLGYHEHGIWINDGIIRPLLDEWSYMNDGEGVYILAQEPQEWGNWKVVNAQRYREPIESWDLHRS